MPVRGPSGIIHRFQWLFRSQGQVGYVLLTRSPLYSPEGFRARLACLIHTANVRSEPGSNPSIIDLLDLSFFLRDRAGKARIPNARTSFKGHPDCQRAVRCRSALYGGFQAFGRVRSPPPGVVSARDRAPTWAEDDRGFVRRVKRGCEIHFASPNVAVTRLRVTTCGASSGTPEGAGRCYSRTTIGAPSGRISNNRSTLALWKRTHPSDEAMPMLSGSFVPWNP